jgi:hypothetical protein
LKKQVMAVFLVCIFLVGGCGNKPADDVSQKGQSFAAVARPTEAVSSAVPTTAGNKGTIGTSEIFTATVTDSTNSQDAKQTEPAPTKSQAVPTSGSTPNSTSINSPEKSVDSTGKSDASSQKSVDVQTKVSASVKPVSPTPPVQQLKEPEKSASSSVGVPEILWSEFFDNDKQNTPSDKFWNLNGKTVRIKGFMGEVLSFEKHWFLIIPMPGAECPFDNGDETYWNKIMIAFVPNDTKLRYTQGALSITGKLDVGIKLDQSGYKTMFRLNDAHFEKIKE